MLRLKAHLQSLKEVKREVEKILVESEGKDHLSARIVRGLFEDPAQGKMFEAPAPAVSEAADRFMRIIRRYASRREWIVDEEREMLWFAEEVETGLGIGFKPDDLRGSLAQWEAFVEAEYDRKRERKANKFPVRFKVSLINWLRHEKRYASNHTGKLASDEIRAKVKKASVGRRETRQEFEDRVRRICERKGVRYEAPGGGD